MLRELALQAIQQPAYADKLAATKAIELSLAVDCGAELTPSAPLPVT